MIVYLADLHSLILANVLNGTLSDGLCVKLNLAITDCNQCKWQGLHWHKCPIDTDFVYDIG